MSSNINAFPINEVIRRLESPVDHNVTRLVATANGVCLGHEHAPLLQLHSNKAVGLIKSPKVDNGSSNHITGSSSRYGAGEGTHLLNRVWVLPLLGIAHSSKIVQNSVFVEIVFILESAGDPRDNHGAAHLLLCVVTLVRHCVSLLQHLITHHGCRVLSQLRCGVLSQWLWVLLSELLTRVEWDSLVQWQLLALVHRLVHCLLKLILAKI